MVSDGIKKKKTNIGISDITITYETLVRAWSGIQQLYGSSLPIREAIRVRYIVNILKPDIDIHNDLVREILKKFGAIEDGQGNWKSDDNDQIFFPSKNESIDASKELEYLLKQEASFSLEPLDIYSITLNGLSITGFNINSMIEAGILTEEGE